MAGQLTKKELELILELKKAGVLERVVARKARRKRGVILVTCSDRKRFPDIFRHQYRIQRGRRRRKDPDIHVFAWHGGGIACAPRSPVNERPNDHRFCVSQIVNGRHWTKITTVLFKAHAPCTAAKKAGVDLRQAILLHVRAAMHVKTAIGPRTRLILFFHVDYDGETKHTYRLNLKKLRRWGKEKGVRIPA